MKILVSGAGGFIGSHIAERLAKMGNTVIAFSRQVPIPLLEYNNISIKVGDINDSSMLNSAIDGVEAIIHCAALLASRTYDKEKVYQINYHATENLLDLAYKNGITNFLHISSGGVLGDIKNPPADESHPYNPQDAYEESKMLAEKKVIEYSKKGLNVIIVRPTWSYGERDKRVFKLINSIKKRKILKIGKCDNLQHPVYISDLVDGIILALQKGKNGSIYFIGGNEHLTTNQIIDIIANLLAVNIIPFHIPIAPMKKLAKLMDKLFEKINKEAPFSETKLGFFTKTRAFSINKAKEELEYLPKVSFIEGMRKTIQWYYEQKWLLT
jgi:nucleoside-diphosphate-sugar epimerase